MINEDKILEYLHNELKLSLYEVTETHAIKVKSTVMNLKKLMDFVESLNYYLSYNSNGCLYIYPKG